MRKSEERGRTRLDWLDSRHTFSFGEYFDRDHMGFGPLRVINEDVVAPRSGFGMHPHRDMEIVTYVLSGRLMHQDTIGAGSILEAGDVQRMSAGTGILHSEENPSPDDAVHFVQIWIAPERPGLKPDYEQRRYADAEKRSRLLRIAGPGGGSGALLIHQDVELFASVLAPGDEVSYALRPGRQAWLQVVGGNLALNGVRLGAGDGAAARDVPSLGIRAEESAETELLLFDMA